MRTKVNMYMKLKNTITELENSMERLTSKMDQAALII